MATKVIKRDEFKRGDTAGFMYVFTEPYAGYDWTNVTIDCSFTAVEAPNDNTGAAATRIDQVLVVDSSNTASYLFQLTETESQSLIPGATYKDECQLKENGTYKITPVTGQTKIVQDYII